MAKRMDALGTSRDISALTNVPVGGTVVFMYVTKGGQPRFTGPNRAGDKYFTDFSSDKNPNPALRFGHRWSVIGKVKATQVAASALETMKGRLADSAAFKGFFDQTESAPKTASDHQTRNNLDYAVNISVARAPAPLYPLTIKSTVTWKSTHQVKLGMVFPGKSASL